MMADINLDARATGAAARRLSECGDELLAARRTTGASIETMGSARPWGRDDLGHIFARRYEEAAGRVLDLWRKTAEDLGELGSRVRHATTSTVETDLVTSEVIDRVL